MRVFLAVSIPRFEGTVELMDEAGRIPYSKPVRTPEFHLTFRFFGEVAPGYVEELMESLSHTPFAKFLLKVNGIDAFPSMEKTNVLFLEVGNSPAIAENAYLAAHINPVAKEKRPFVPHITVCRFNRPANCTFLKKKYGSISFEKEINEITVYESTLTSNGPVYNRLKTFQLK